MKFDNKIYHTMIGDILCFANPMLSFHKNEINKPLLSKSMLCFSSNIHILRVCKMYPVLVCKNIGIIDKLKQNPTSQSSVIAVGNIASGKAK